MPIINGDPDGALLRRIDELASRLKTLEAVPQINNSVVTNGQMTFVDSAGATRAIIGLLPDGSFGAEILDKNGNTMFLCNDAGLSFPEITLPTRLPNTAAPAVTSAVFTTVWEAPIGWVSGDTLFWSSIVICDAATTGEARLLVPNIVSAPVTATITLPAGQTQVLWKWQIPGLSFGTTGQVLAQLQVRRTAGAGNVWAYTPDSVYLGNHIPLGGTPTGL